MSRSRNPPSPLLIRSMVLALSAFMAASVFMSMALASAAVPFCWAKADTESVRTATDAAAVMTLRVMAISPCEAVHAHGAGSVFEYEVPAEWHAGCSRKRGTFGG